MFSQGVSQEGMSEPRKTLKMDFHEADATLLLSPVSAWPPSLGLIFSIFQSKKFQAQWTRTAVSFHSDFSSVTFPLVSGGTEPTKDILGKLRRGSELKIH